MTATSYTKLQKVTELSQKTLETVAKSGEEWMLFLKTAAKMYKYPFEDQVLIHAQRPDATACASYDTWNGSMHRWVTGGSKGIALINDTGDSLKLKYVYDVSDTSASWSSKSRTPYIWELRKEHEAFVVDKLADEYGRHGESIENQLIGMTEHLVSERYTDNPDALEFNETLKASLKYCLLSRCGLNAAEYLTNDDFKYITSLDDFGTLTKLGAAVSKVSEEVLRQIEKSIKEYERERVKINEGSNELGRNNIPLGRGLSDTGFNYGRGIRTTDREIRPDAEEVPAGTPNRNLFRDVANGKIDGTFAGDRRNGENETGAVNGRNAGKGSGAGQGSRSDGLGAAHEQPESVGGGNYNERADIQLTQFPSEQNRIGAIQKAEDDKVSAFFDSTGETAVVAKVYDETSKPIDFSITDENLGVGGAKTKYGYNVAAIRTLNQIESEGRFANPKEQEILSKYVGWGGIPQAFDKDNASWAKEYKELGGLLSKDEYASARASTLNAHYTSPGVIRTIYEAIEKMGFRTGNILEPACGIGNFFGMLPDSMSGSKLYGVELDSITGRIAKQLYQKASINVSGFESCGYPDNFFDLAIGNVPFGSYKVSDRQYDKYNFLIHDFFFAKTLDKIRPGGIIAFVTSKGTLDKQSPDIRKYLAQRAELLGAVRLPNNAFQANAGTEVTTDIIFLQKRDRLIDIQPDWIHITKNGDGVPVNSYYADNPHMILGEMVYDKKMYGKESDTACRPFTKPDKSQISLSELLREAVNHLPEDVYSKTKEIEITEAVDNEKIPADPSVRNFSFTIADGNIYYRENSEMIKINRNCSVVSK